MSKRETRSLRKKVTFYIALLFIVVISIVLISEATLRVLNREEAINGNYWGIGAFSHHDLTGFVHAPEFEGYAYRRDAFYTPVSINSQSLRQSDLERQLRFPRKLLVLGDSFTFGLGVLEENSFASLIKKDLNPLGVGVINGGQAAYSVEQERLFGIPLIEKFKPDAVILGAFAGNDFAGDYNKKYLNIEVRHGYRLRKDRWLPIGPLDYLRTHSYLWMFLENRRNMRQTQKDRALFRADGKPSLQEFMQPTLTAIAKLRDYCEKNRIQFGVVMIPRRSGVDHFARSLRAFLRAENIAVLDLDAKGYSLRDYFRWDGHWNDAGHKKAARHLMPFVEKILETRQE